MKKPFDHVLVIMFENQYRNYVMQDAFMRKLASAGASMSNFFGAFHPSQTNYLASLAGEVCAVTNDTPPVTPLMQETLVDLMEPAGITWKAYMEGYPGEPWNPKWKSPDYAQDLQPINKFPNDGKRLANYFRKHNAFASFHSIQANEERWGKIVGEKTFWEDVFSKELPAYSWFTPDIWNDGHYLYNTHVDTNPRTQLIPQISGWLEYVFFADIATTKVQGGVQTGLDNIGLNLDIDLLISDPESAWANSRLPARTLIVVTFDEADFDAVGYDTSYEGPNQVYTVLLGDMIPPGTVIETPYNHYSLIKTIQKNFGLGDLGKNDRDANWFRFLWCEEFSWTEAKDTGLKGSGILGVARGGGEFNMVFQADNGSLMSSRLVNGQWSAGEETGLSFSGPCALSSVDDILHLVYSDINGLLMTSHFNGSNWTDPVSLKVITSGSIAMTEYWDDADQQRKLMLCWQGPGSFIQYLVYEYGNWQKIPGEVGQLTDGTIAVGQIGPSLFLLYKTRNTRGISMTSYNTAPFNAFKALAFDDSDAPDNDTSLHQWSPRDMPVGHFSKKSNLQQSDYLCLGNFALASIEGELHLVHRGGYADKQNANTTIFGLTGIFTAARQLTNGYGTIEQAGWTLEKLLNQISLDIDSPLAMGSDGEKMVVIWQKSNSNAIQYLSGGYSNSQ